MNYSIISIWKWYTIKYDDYRFERTWTWHLIISSLLVNESSNKQDKQPGSAVWLSGCGWRVSDDRPLSPVSGYAKPHDSTPQSTLFQSDVLNALNSTSLSSFRALDKCKGPYLLAFARGQAEMKKTVSQALDWARKNTVKLIAMDSLLHPHHGRAGRLDPQKQT